MQWEELIERCQEAGVDAFEINFSCPHGMPERRMGMAMGQVRGGGPEHPGSISAPQHRTCAARLPARLTARLCTDCVCVCVCALQDCELLHEVCGWINAKSTIPVWAKMTPNVTGGWRCALAHPLFVLCLPSSATTVFHLSLIHI